MTETMLDKMAEAIGRQMAEDDNDNIDLARAALQAIRVPGLAEWAALGPTQCETVGQVRTAYTAMIDAILEGKA